jgi:hypothetical protein
MHMSGVEFVGSILMVIVAGAALTVMPDLIEYICIKRM